MIKNPHTDSSRAFSALLKNMQAASHEEVRQIPIEEIEANPFQPRGVFNELLIWELAQSIKKYGVLQPILLRKKNNKYQLVSGERRWRACCKAKLCTVPAIVRAYSDKETMQIALVENLQRENLNAIEEARAYEQLLVQTKLTQSRLAEYVGKSRSHIGNFLRLLHLTKNVRQLIMEGKLSMGQAKPLLAISNKKEQEKAAFYIIEHSLSAREAERLVKKFMRSPSANTKKATSHNIYLDDMKEQLMLSLGTRVEIKNSGKKNKLEIEFTSEDELERIIEKLLEKAPKKKVSGGNFFV